MVIVPLFNEYLLSLYCVPDPMGGTGDTTMIKMVTYYDRTSDILDQIGFSWLTWVLRLYPINTC